MCGEGFAEDAQVLPVLHSAAGAGVSPFGLAASPGDVQVVLRGVLVLLGDVHHVAGLELECLCHVCREVDAPVGVEGDVCPSRGVDEWSCHLAALHLKVTVSI